MKLINNLDSSYIGKYAMIYNQFTRTVNIGKVVTPDDNSNNIHNRYNNCNTLLIELNSGEYTVVGWGSHCYILNEEEELLYIALCQV